MNRSTPGLPVHHQLPEFTQTHVRVSDAIQPSHPLSSPPAPNPSQHQGLFQRVHYYVKEEKVALVVKNPPANVEDARDTRWLDGITDSKYMSFSKLQGDSEG